MQNQKMKSDGRSLQKRLVHWIDREKKNQIIAESEIMKKISADLVKIARSCSSVFISGESGTGKEVIAAAIHAESERAAFPFIKVNCAAIPEALIESEFFGHEKGAFTGAFHRKLGRFELADKGTLLLDEISEIPLHVQSKLLRAVQEREFERIGAVTPTRVDVRLIATSNRDMKAAIEQKLFREDLYYRLHVVPISLPPLRERKEDILPLADFFLQRLCGENKTECKSLSSEACQKLVNYNWPGNIRELANVIERTVVMEPSSLILASHLYLDCPLPASKEKPFCTLPQSRTLQEVEKQLILETLESQKQSRSKTAEILGISVRTLQNKLKAYRSLP
jgi:two-component system, NtrC family, response regulator AtoC